jgi:hypothetical protein
MDISNINGDSSKLKYTKVDSHVKHVGHLGLPELQLSSILPQQKEKTQRKNYSTSPSFETPLRIDKHFTKKRNTNQLPPNATIMSLPTTTAKSTYRALLRELPRRSLASPTPLHNRVRDAYRKPATTNTLNEEETLRRLQEAEQFAQYAKAQRTYAMLVDRYNPGSLMDEEERVRLTARRVGLDLPELVGAAGKKEDKE